MSHLIREIKEESSLPAICHEIPRPSQDEGINLRQSSIRTSREEVRAPASSISSSGVSFNRKSVFNGD